jgi:NADH:ubiquinone oxidoreductase subunit B-like Fe-S oxidoreductase
MDQSKIEVLGENIDNVSKKFLLPVNFTQPLDTFVTGVYPNVDVYIGGACQTCWLMAALVLPNLAKIPSGSNGKTSLICGIDPKVPTGKNWNLENTFILGDCALGCSGEMREIRNKIAIAGFDTFLPGCPPYEQALVKLEDILIERGILKEEGLIEKAKEHRDKFFDYYKKFDPTWEPEI